MKISGLRIFPVGQFVFVKILTDEGIHGIGEASLSGRSMAVVEALKHIEPLLVGQDATRIEFIWQDVFRGTFWRGGPVLQSALAGIDIALWDLAGRALGVPTYRLLGGAARDKVLGYRHTSGGPPERLIDDAHRLMDDGWRVLRISPIRCEGGFNPQQAVRRGIEHLGALRRAIGDEPEVILEVHTRLSPPRAVELCRSVEEFHPFFVEDPIRSENPASFATLRRQTSVPIGTGEQLPTKWAFRELIESELIDYIRVDICHSGGITEGKKIAAMGEVHYQELATHFTGSHVGTAAMLHLNMSIPNCAVQEYGPPPSWMDDVTPHDYQVEGGYLSPSDSPGLGIDLDEEAAAAHPYAPRENTHLRREDGSVQDW